MPDLAHWRHAIGRSAVARDVALIFGAWLVLTVLVWPAGDFPLDDDWTYAKSVQILVQQGRIDLVFAAVPLVAQVVWGALFSVPLGFSFTALRISTWVLGAVGLVATYGLLRTVNESPQTGGWARRLPLLGALLLAVNPLYLTLSLTFMTDVPSLAVSIAALVVLATGLASGSHRTLAAGGALLLLALLIRQPAIAVAAGVGLAWIATRRPSLRSIAIGAALPLAALALLFGYEYVIRRTIGLPPLYGHPYDPITDAAAATPIALVALGRLILVALYLGFFALPLSLVAAGTLWPAVSTSQRRSAMVMVTLAVAGALVLAGNGPIQPLGNVAYDLGLGPPLLRDVYVLDLPHLPAAPALLWDLVAVIAAAGSALLLWVLALGLAALRRRATMGLPRLPLIAAAATLLIYLGFLVVSGFLDRYLLWLLPLVLPLIAVAARGGARPGAGWLRAAAAVALASTLFGVAGAHDYFAWNRSRWAALDDLLAQGVSAARIDGGFEFNGWFGYDPRYQERPGLSWWWVRDDEYVVSFGPLDGYTEVARYPYDRWLPPGGGAVLVLQRSSAHAVGG
jgi:hypothetical protein